VLDPGQVWTKTGRLWGYAVDDRPRNGGTPPAAVYLYAEEGKGEHPAAHLAEFQGVPQVDGYSGSVGLLEPRNRGPRPPRRGSSPASASTARASVPAAPAGALRLSP
jgi:hypothetical protein